MLGLANQKTAGISDEAYLTFTKVLFQDMKKTMGTCTNIAVLFNKYSDFCWHLNQDADPRLRAWIACIALNSGRAADRACPKTSPNRQNEHEFRSYELDQAIAFFLLR